MGGWRPTAPPRWWPDPRCQSGKHLPGACGAPRPRKCPFPGSHAGARPLLCPQGCFIVRGAGWGGVWACVDAQLRKCRGQQAHSGWEGAAGQECGSEVVSWDFHCPRGAPASSTLSSEVPQLETGGRPLGQGPGSPGYGLSSKWGSTGTGTDTGQAGSGSGGSWPQSSGDTGAHSPESGGEAAPQGLECVWQRVQGGTGQPWGARGQAEPQSLSQKWDSGPGCRDPWWVLLVPGGPGGCRGNSRAEVGVEPGGGARVGCFGGNVRWRCGAGPRPQGKEEARMNLKTRL